jgi:hypothetical protein
MIKTQTGVILPATPKRIGIAADHGGYELKEFLAGKLREAGYEVVDFGDGRPKEDDDYPDFIVPLARAIAAGTVDRGVGICGSGVGASVCANKVAGVRHANRGDVDSGLWIVHAAHRLGLGTHGMGLLFAVFPHQRPRETARLSDF